MKRVIIVVVVIGVVVVGGYFIWKGSDNRGASRDAAGLEKSARWRVEDIAKGDWKRAYDSMQLKCRAKVTYDQFKADAQASVDRAKAAGFDISRLRLDSAQVMMASSTVGEVRETRSIDGVPFGESSTSIWNYEGGRRGGSWYTLDCGIGV